MPCCRPLLSRLLGFLKPLERAMGFEFPFQQLGNEIRFRKRQNTHGIPAKRLSSHAQLERRFTLTFPLKFNNSNLY